MKPLNGVYSSSSQNVRRNLHAPVCNGCGDKVGMLLRRCYAGDHKLPGNRTLQMEVVTGINTPTTEGTTVQSQDSAPNVSFPFLPYFTVVHPVSRSAKMIEILLMAFVAPGFVSINTYPASAHERLMHFCALEYTHETQAGAHTPTSSETDLRSIHLFFRTVLFFTCNSN